MDGSSAQSLYREEKAKALQERRLSHAQLMTEAKEAFAKMLADAQLARKGGRPRTNPLLPPKPGAAKPGGAVVAAPVAVEAAPEPVAAKAAAKPVVAKAATVAAKAPAKVASKAKAAKSVKKTVTKAKAAPARSAKGSAKAAGGAKKAAPKAGASKAPARAGGAKKVAAKKKR